MWGPDGTLFTCSLAALHPNILEVFTQKNGAREVIRCAGYDYSVGSSR